MDRLSARLAAGRPKNLVSVGWDRVLDNWIRRKLRSNLLRRSRSSELAPIDLPKHRNVSIWSEASRKLPLVVVLALALFVVGLRLITTKIQMKMDPRAMWCCTEEGEFFLLSSFIMRVFFGSSGVIV
jgi:hypothetical protein